MDICTTNPVKEIPKEKIIEIVEDIIIVSSHAIDHLSLMQRKVFKEGDLIHMIEKEQPRKAYIQENGRYALYYRRSDGYRKLIISIENKILVIVTFMDSKEIPKW